MLVKLTAADVDVEKVVCCTSCEKTRQEKRRLLSSNGVFENSDDFDDHPRTSFSNFDDNLSDDDEDSLSLLELQRDLTPFQLSDRNVDKSTNGNSTSIWKPPHPPASDTLSTLSSVSSMTLQAGTKAN
jgi:hypothetical protein